MTGNEPMTFTKCRNSISYSSSSQLHAINCDALLCFRSNSMTKNTGNCNYQERAGNIILRNTTNEHLTGAELLGNFSSNFLSCSSNIMESLSGRTLSAKSTVIFLRAVNNGGVSNETFKS